MYKRDDSFEPLPRYVVHRTIPDGRIGYAHLNNVEAIVFVTTTPQIDVMTFRRSPRVSHYAIVQHALGESRYVRPYAYDYYDSVFCCGPILKNNIRKMEKIRESREKELYETGLPHYDELINEAGSCEEAQASRPVVLIAPSWGPLSIFEAFGTGFVREVAQRFQVIVRPHPQMRVSQPHLYAEVLALEGIEVSTDRTPAAALSRAQILLSDISGIAHEFAFIYQRPVLVIDRAMKLGGLEGELLGGDSELKERCAKFIIPVPQTEIGRISEHIELALKKSTVHEIQEAREALIYNFGYAGDNAAQQLETIFYREKSRKSAKSYLAKLGA